MGENYLQKIYVNLNPNFRYLVGNESLQIYAFIDQYQLTGSTMLGVLLN